MKIIEIGTGYTTIPAKIGAATEIVIENLISEFNKNNVTTELIDISYIEKSNSSFKQELNTVVHIQKLPKFLSKINDNGIIHFTRRILYSVKVGFFLHNYLKHQNEQIFLHFHNQFNFFFFYLICRQRLKRIYVITIYTAHSPGWSFFVKIPLSLLLEKFSIKKSNITIALTRKIKNQIITLIKKVDPERISVIPNGVNTHLFKKIESVQKEKAILNIGSICRRKNQLETIIILKDFLIKNSYIFKYAGKIVEQNYFEEINTFVKKNKLENNVFYLGEVKPDNDLVLLYNSSKFYVSNSKYEAFSLVVLESLACGLPVLLSDSFEQSLSAFKNDTFLQICSNEQFIMRINCLIRDEVNYKKISDNAQEFINSNFSWERIIVKYSQILNKH